VRHRQANKAVGPAAKTEAPVISTTRIEQISRVWRFRHSGAQIVAAYGATTDALDADSWDYSDS